MMMNLVHMLAATKGTFWLPAPASNLATDVDWAWNVILYTTGLFFCIVVGAMTLFVIRYRRRNPNDATSEITHNTPLEVAWTVIPLILVIMFFYVGFKGFLTYDNPASNCVVIDVEAKKWQFTFTYPNGAQDRDLYVLKGQPVRLNLHSVDVLHAVYLPNFRTQRNAIPFRQTSIWFEPTEFSPTEGWPIFCTQYCGDGHSRMFSHVYVLDPIAFDEKMKELANPFKRKLANGKNEWVPYVELGEKLYHQIGCATCHSVDDKETIGTGPPWHGLWKRDHEFSYIQPGSFDAPDGKFELKASDPDDKWIGYITESIISPEAKLVRYHGTDFHGMSSFASQLSGNVINDEKRRAIIEFIKSKGTLPYQPAVPPKSEYYDADKYPDHPESLAGIKAREAAASQTRPGGQ